MGPGRPLSRPSMLVASALAAALLPGASSSKESSDTTYPARIETLVVRDVLEQDGSAVRTVEVRVLLRDAVGIAQFGQIAAPYLDGYGDVSFEDVVIEKVDGRRIQVAGIAPEEINPLGMSGLSLPADFRIRRLTVPGLASGDTLHYRTVTRQKALFADIVFGEFRFIAMPDTADQVYELDSPASLRLLVRHGPGADWQEIPVPSGRRVRRLVRRGPADTPRAAASGTEAAEPDVEYTTFRSWDEVGRWWWGLASKAFATDAAVRAEAERLAARRPDPRSRMEALHAFVSTQIRYLNVGFGSGRYRPRPATEALAARYADCKGKHALLAALASALGIEAWPVLVHSGRRDLHDDVPSPAQFDHVISVVGSAKDPSGWLWLDASTDLAPAGYLPPPLRGKRALLVDREGGRLVSTPERPPYATRLAVDARMSLDSSGPLRARVRWTAHDDAEPMLRAVIRASPREKWKELGQRLAEEWERGVVSEVVAGDPTDLREPFWVEYAVEHTMTSRTFEKDWTLWVPLPEMRLPQVDTATGAPVMSDLDDEVVYSARLELPEGMRARAPLSVVLDRDFASYRSTYAVEGRTLSLERALRVKLRMLGSGQRAAYEAFRSAVEADRRQEFQVEALQGAAGIRPETADSLNEEGAAALDDRGDAALAARLLQRAVQLNPEHKWAWNNLGRALRRLGRSEEALKAFGRQIDINAYDPYAYDNRGATLLFDLGRREEAERDFLKQIEVAPLQAYAYEDLAHLRTLQERFAEAAELLERATAARPSDANLWLKLAWARARAGRPGTDDAVRRARALDASSRKAIVAARALSVSGDSAGAAAVAREALPSLQASLDAEDPARLDDRRGERDLLYLAEAWRLIGASALEADDLGAADRYLTASWELGSTPDAARDLGRLRERQGRASEAVSIWQQGSFLRTWRGNPARKELERAVTEPSRLARLLETGAEEMAKRQIQNLGGAAPAAMVEIRVRLLVDERGRIRAVGPHKREDAGRLESLRERVLAATLAAPNPDAATFKLVRGGTVTCYPSSGCLLGLDLYGDEVASTLER